MPHFDKNTPGSKIHTVKGGGPCPHAKALAKKNSGRASCGYRKICGTFPYDPWEAHHVLCVEAVNMYGSLNQYSAYVSKIDDCYKMTDWCINQKPNLLAMPEKAVYRKLKDSYSLDIPCHDWDHTCTDGYFDEVVKALENSIWQAIKKAVDTANQKKTHFNEYAVLQEFQALEKDFQSKLATRGLRSGGTANGWRNKENLTNNWWLPFSMAKNSVAKRRKVFSF